MRLETARQEIDEAGIEQAQQFRAQLRRSHPHPGAGSAQRGHFALRHLAAADHQHRPVFQIGEQPEQRCFGAVFHRWIPHSRSSPAKRVSCSRMPADQRTACCARRRSTRSLRARAGDRAGRVSADTARYRGRSSRRADALSSGHRAVRGNRSRRGCRIASGAGRRTRCAHRVRSGRAASVPLCESGCSAECLRRLPATARHGGPDSRHC